MSFQVLITFQIALQVCMGLQVISGQESQDVRLPDYWKLWALARSGGGHPPVTQNLTSDLAASCSCGKVLLSSLGPAANFQPQAMGTYTL